MLRIIDARTGRLVAAAPVRRGLTRVEVHASGYGMGALRALVVADLLVRALELEGTPVWALLTGARDQAELRAGAAALGARPFEDSRDVGAGLGEAQVVHVVESAAEPPEGVWLAVAPVEAVTSPSTAWDADPAVLRLALLSGRRSAPLRLGTQVLGEAHDSLVRWRRGVAQWARQPSRPVPEEVRGRLRAAWEDDLDMPRVLDELRRVGRDPDVPDGARFETYVYADRLLGLDLARDLGSPA